ncbi:MAG: Spy/CpxP family protein refolding chaperone [Deltaproteobacteria bacterium]|nr:Spy/CpxP family protein refolding chaperone [Deltaproteobacteria bacterium]
MKTRNKVLIGAGVLFLVLAVSGYGLVSAYGPWGGPCGGYPHRFHSRGFHSDAHHKDMADYVLWRMDKKAGQLNLTAAQKAKYEAIRENLKSHLSEFQTGHKKMKDQFDREINKEEPDMKLLVESTKTKLHEVSGFMNKNLDLLLDFYSSLDNRQKAMVNDEIRERMKYHRS